MVDFFAVYLVIMLGVATVKAVPSPNKSNKSLLCMVGSQRCVADSQSDTKALFETCVQATPDTVAWVTLACGEGTKCFTYPTNTNFVYCG
ncbi:hypothetical protein BDV3_006404 [Batrachochytrium dendrobatidis]|nr:hypothetical protein O5D80_002885 [Batrachochytrium dendrobatidis]KAK5668869.1 hypothetical protein QVD99_004648 [Batrachochytrium dendrobatidis]